ncbi:hypothetical protein K435DRAFT_871072 [Dendrothele bispora CBS 962.96]|uniref:Uncharacterized protein n=1 Tax=Dendrothele bispora (strain CBS 962.96) TaxID=1314807 RepID=A0A4S8L5F1_DENBC|nr:hypothetical protein K435DRAFT_871072 [Dendrothele bispora CBS 962.96]
MAIGDLLVSAGPSLESFKFCVKVVGIPEEGLNLDASLQHINFTKNPNLRNITLDVDAPAYLVPFLQRLTKSRYPPSLKKLHIPRLVPEKRSIHFDCKRIDGLLQHPYFSALGEFRCRQCVLPEIGEEWYNGRPIEGSQSWKEMESKIEELKVAMPKLADKGILQKYCTGARASSGVMTFREDASNEDQYTENNDQNRNYCERCRLMGILDGDEMDWEVWAAGHFGRKEKVEMAKGLTRVDWLGGEGMVTWIGLVRGEGGVWEMKM